jgi:hypothetical protein
MNAMYVGNKGIGQIFHLDLPPIPNPFHYPIDPDPETDWMPPGLVFHPDVRIIQVPQIIIAVKIS